MSKDEVVHYNIDKADKTGALFTIIYGQRSNGKSYQVKHKKAIEMYVNGGNNYLYEYTDISKLITLNIEKGSRFVLVRRYLEEVSNTKIEQYFKDVDVEKITNKQYNCIKCQAGQIFLANWFFDEKDKRPKFKFGELIGYVIPLSLEQNYAGGSYLDVDDMIMEEFMSRKAYLHDEPDKLINLWSTIDRDRGTTRLWLVGNTISKICPYLTDWGLQKLMKNQKQGEIRSTWLPTGKIDKEGREVKVKLAIEYCIDYGGKGLAIGKHANMLNTGEWQTDPQPHLPKSRKLYDLLYRIVFMYQTYKFIGEYLFDKENNSTIWFIYPYDGEIKENILVFSDEIKPSPYWQRNIYDLNINNDNLKKLLYNTFRENRIFYSDDECGTDFKQVIDFDIKR